MINSPVNQELFPPRKIKCEKQENRILTLQKGVNYNEEILTRIKDFLLESQNIYPSIDQWWERKVIPGLRSGERQCEAMMTNGEISALSIIKYSKESSKLCTLRVRENYRSLGFGQSLLRRSLSNLLSKNCKRVHYSISEEVLSNCGDFFTPYSFNMTAWNKHRYVKGRDELNFSVGSSQLLHRIETVKINRAENRRTAVMLSIKPEYADLIEQGHKRVEFRRRFKESDNAIVGFFYVTSPVKQIRFVARIERAVKSTPSCLWDQFKGECGVCYSAFCEYFEGASEGTALVLSEVQRLRQPIDQKELERSSINFLPPQSCKFLSDGDPLLVHLNSKII